LTFLKKKEADIIESITKSNHMFVLNSQKADEFLKQDNEKIQENNG
jgi:hypothetical protein